MQFRRFGWLILISVVVSVGTVWLMKQPQPAVLSDSEEVQHPTRQVQPEVMIEPAQSPVTASPAVTEKSLERSIEHIRDTVTNLVATTREIVSEVGPVEPILLMPADGVIEVFGQANVWSLPTDKINTNSLLQLSYNIITEEQAPGFDYPAVRLLVDDQVIYQVLLTELDCFPATAATCESGWRTIQLSLEPFVTPRQLTIISGNTGDESFFTKVQIKNVKLLPTLSTGNVSPSSVKAIGDLTTISDPGSTLTIAWTAPDNTSLWLDRALTYDIRYSSETISPRITSQEWASLPVAEIIFPEFFSPLAPGFSQRALVSWPAETARPVALAIRASDEQGRLSPLIETSIVVIPPAD